MDKQKKISGKAVLSGGSVDFLTRSILAIPLAIYGVRKLNSAHLNPGKDDALIVALFHDDLWFQIVPVLLGIFSGILGGYVAARIANRNELLNGSLAALICATVSFYSLVTGKWHPPLIQILLLVLSPALGSLGGWLCLRQRSPQPVPA